MAPNDLDELLLDIVTRLQAVLKTEDAEVAHLKAIGLWEGFFGVANLVSSDTQPMLSLASKCLVKEADVIVNARVAIDPAILQTHVERIVNEVSAARKAQPAEAKTQSFRPGRPTPTHRYAIAQTR